MGITWILLLVGVVLLTAGAEGLVRGSVTLAERLGISPLVVGLTVVAFGTSAPELVVSLGGALRGVPGIAVGNVVGSNIGNIALILAVSAIISPIRIQAQVVSRDAPIMIGATAVVVAFMFDAYLSRLEGFVLFLGIVFYTAFSYLKDRDVNPGVVSEIVPGEPGVRHAAGVLSGVVLIMAGLAGLVFGADLFVRNASQIARLLGVSETVIGLSIVAVGTSLPELATCVAASIRKAPDLVAGNIVGSNIFNLLCILGLVAFISPVPAALSALDFFAFVVSALFVWFVMRTGHRVTRLEGVALLAAYLGYVTMLYL